MEFYQYLDENRRIHFCEGVVLSIQAGAGYYSEPREDLAFDLFLSYEVGIINANVSGLECLDSYLDTKEEGLAVYGYVPAHLVEDTFLHLKRRYGMKEPIVKQEMQPVQEVKTAESAVRTSIARKLKQGALIYAMKHTEDEEVYQQLANKLESTITFTED